MDQSYRQWFVEPETSAPQKGAPHPVSYLRKVFQLRAAPQKAEVIVSACGLCTTWLNGKPVTDQLLLPGFTCYQARLQAMRFDVTGLLRMGDNVVTASVADGWYRGWNGAAMGETFPAHFGEKQKYLLVLEVEYPDGIRETLHTDNTWRATQNGPLRQADLRSGEIYDAALELTDWESPEYAEPPAAEWHDVRLSPYGAELIETEGEPIREHERFTPRVLAVPNGEMVLDFGQNFAGYVRFTVTGPVGHTVTLLHGETLDEDGNFTLKNLQGADKDPTKPRPPFGQVITYTLKAGCQTYQPTYAVHGFRYAKLLNWPEEVNPEQFTGIAVYSDLPQVGEFSCSNPLVNKLVENTQWSLKSNFIDIPTDCPHRERAGWTGDAMVFCQTASWLRDTRKFFRKWLRDVAIQQTQEGLIQCIVPDIGRFAAKTNGSAGWGDVIEIMPWMLYQNYDDKTALAEFYPYIKRWVEANRRRARKRNITHLFNRGDHAQFILDTGYHWGEWCEPGKHTLWDTICTMKFPDAEVATAYYGYAALLLSRMAGVLGRTDDEKEYRTLFQQIKDAYHKEFLPEGRSGFKRQCRHVRPVALELAEGEEVERLMADLDNLVRENGYKIGTGFLSTPHILRTLGDNGHLETAYRLLENTQQPGWLYAVTKGATTIWERWDAVDESGHLSQASLNHYSPGSVVSWLFDSVAGIRPTAPGFARVQIRPMPGGSLTWAKCSYHSVRGLIRSEWALVDGGFSLTVEVPPDTEAVVILPSGKESIVGSGVHTFYDKAESEG